MFYYAQLDENNICIGVSCLSGEVQNDNLVRIDSMNDDYIWKKYENEQWSTEKFEPESTAPLTEFEETKQRVADVENAVASIIGGAM